MGEGALQALDWFRQVVPRPSGGKRLTEPSAAFVRSARERGYDAVASAFSDASLLERAFANNRPQLGSVPHDPPAAAVLLPVIGGRSTGSEARLVLIRRAGHLRSNPGEIAFAGGRIEPGESPLQAALREAEEEISLEPARVRVLGELRRVTRRSVAESIAPFVATLEGEPTMAGNPAEVDEVLMVPLAGLADPDRYFEEDWPLPEGEVRRMAFFDIGDDVIWGASAAILVLMLNRMAAVLDAGEGETPKGVWSDA